MKTLTLLFLLISSAWSSEQVCHIAEKSLSEISGIAFSKKHPDVFWVHNDSGDRPYLFAVSLSGTVLAKLLVSGGTAGDWEDLAIGACPDSSRECFYIGDIGDKKGKRQQLSVLVVEVPSSLSAASSLAVKRVISFAGQGMNFESLAWNSHARNFLLIEKKGKRFGAKAKNPAMYSLDLAGQLSYLQDLNLKEHADDSEDTLVTAADYQQDTGKLLVGTYGKVFILNASFQVELVKDIPELAKAEAAAWGPDGIFVSGEDLNPTLWKITY